MRRSTIPASSGGGIFSCSAEKVYIALALAAIVWIGGIFLLLGYGGRRDSLEHPTGPHSHVADLMPRAYAPTAPGSTQDVSVESNRQGRGFGLAQLDNLEKDIKMGLHQFFQHSTEFEHPTSRYSNAHQQHQPHTPQHPETPIVTTPTTHEKPAATNTPPPTGVKGKRTKVPVFTTHSKSFESVKTPNGGMTKPAIVILTYKRKPYLIRTLESLLATPEVADFEIYISQDGSDPDLSDLAPKYATQHKITLLNHMRVALMVPDQGPTAYLAQHYKWVLDLLFLEKGHSHVVIMEDDMLVSPDFLKLFIETAHLLDSDPTLFCVSSWNDNGMERLVADNTRLMRTDYFPGLGWMTNKAVWQELSPIFPLDQWDHFMRLDTTHKGRDCLIPEVARNHNIGEEGTNMGQNFYGRFLAPIAFNQEITTFLRNGNLEHMRGENFEKLLHEEINNAKILGVWGSPDVSKYINAYLSSSKATLPNPPEETWVITYERSSYPNIALMLGLLPVPRSIHKGILSVRLGPHLVYFADVKICPYLPASHRQYRDGEMVVTVANQNEACTNACARNGGVCMPGQFQYINQCSELKALFECKKGCRGGVSGLDVPNYVDNPTKPELYGYCLTTEDTSTCDSSHWSASRLCPCKKRQ